MKKISNIITIILLIFTLLFTNSIYVYSAEGAGNSGITIGGTRKIVEGASAAKTGWLISIASSDGTPKDAIFLTTSHNPIFTTTGVSVDMSGLVGRWGAKPTKYGFGVEWGFGPFGHSSSGFGNGLALKQWLLSEYKNGVMGYAFVLENYFGFSPEQIAEFSKDENNRIICEGVMWAGDYVGYDFQGSVYVGTTTSWARNKDMNSCVSLYSHRNLPNSHYLDVDNFITGISVPSDVSSKHDASTILAPVGYGAVAIKPKDGIRLIEVYRTEGAVDNTSYSSCSLPHQLENKGDYKVKSWFLSNKTTEERGNKTDYPVFQGQLPSIASGNGPTTVPENKQALTLVVLYERVPTDTIRQEDEDALLAWENTWVFEEYVADRSGSTHINNTHCVKEDIQEIIDNFAAKPYVVIDDVWYEEEYTINASLGNWQTPIWNLYRPERQDGLFDRYNKAIGSNIYSIHDEVDPKFSYYLSRSLWECLSISPDREGASDFLSMITSPYNQYPITYVGRQGLEQAGNTEILRSETKPYNYTFTTSPIEIRIDYHLEIPVPVEETEEPGLETDIKEETDIELEDTEPEMIIEYVEKEPHIKDYTFVIAQGSTGDNKAYKYKTKATPVSNSGAAGKILAELKGDTLSGTFAKSDGETFSYEPIEAQSVAAEFRGETIKLYPEVMYSLWRNSSAYEYKATPKEYPVFLMGEFKREFTPPICHGYRTSINSGSTMSSSGSLMSAGTGYTAQQISNTAETDLGVTSQGTAFSVNSLGQYEIDIYSVGIHPSDSPAHGEWGNTLTKEDVIASHDAYVESICSLINQELIMEYEFHPSNKKLYMTLLTDEGPLTIQKHSPESVDLYWHDGVYDEAGTVRSYCNSLYSGDTVYSVGMNLESIFDMIFINNNDSIEDNASTGYTGKGENGVTLDRTHWYDEESLSKMTVTKCHTTVTMAQVGATDKIDFNVLTSSYISPYLNQSDYIQVRFYNRLFMNVQDGVEPVTHANGFTYSHTGTYRIEHLVDSDFAVMNSNTSQMRK